MKKAQVQFCLDRTPLLTDPEKIKNKKKEREKKFRKGTDGMIQVGIRVYFNQSYRFYSTGKKVNSEYELWHILFGDRRTSEEKEIEKWINKQKTKAQGTINSLPIFTFEAFEEQYLSGKNLTNDVFSAFDGYIDELKGNGKIGTAVTYECAKKSLSDYKSKLTFAEITPKWLREYEKEMLDKGRSITTVSMYLRSLRAIFNNQNIDKSLYPFGREKGKYSIPTGRNVKKALTLQEVAKIYNYEPKNDVEDMARDYWMFLYLCNGMNVKDFCLLKWENIEGDILTYKRAKTSIKGKEPKPIKIALKPESKAIIRKWGNPSLNKSDFIFPHLEVNMTPIRQRRVYQDLTKQINKYIQRITQKLEIPHHVTTYSARHSFATVLKRSGANIAMISDLLGHSDLSVTQNYLDSFEDDQIQEQTNVLTAGFKKAN